MDGQRTNRIYVIGAGFAGQSIAKELKQKGVLGKVVAFLDDDPEKIGRSIDGIPVLGPIADVVKLLEKTPADEALIAMPSVPRERITELYRILEQAQFARIRILPTISQILDGDAHFIQTRRIDPQDLLGRTPLRVGLKKSLAYLRGKRVLVTGAGGSIGSEISRQLLSGGASRLYLFGHGENSIYEIDRELRLLQEEGVGERATVVPVIGDLKDADYVQFILSRLKADVIFHTAAYKHVPMMEANPVGAVQNNIIGTYNLVEAAKAARTNRLVAISTDKVVEPAGVYGASKRVAEDIVRAAAAEGHGFLVVRFGNVLGSRGSILPLFQKQIAKGGPVTVTDPETKRYFMTIPEASSLVLQVGGIGDPSNLYLLDMGEPIQILELAKQMIRFYGYEPDKDIPISYIGLRPGEKLTETLTEDQENAEASPYPRILQAHPRRVDTAALARLLAALGPICDRRCEDPEAFRNRRRLRAALREYVPSLQEEASEPVY